MSDKMHALLHRLRAFLTRDADSIDELLVRLDAVIESLAARPTDCMPVDRSEDRFFEVDGDAFLQTLSSYLARVPAATKVRITHRDSGVVWIEKA